jgi:hypothetical protein
LAVNAASVTTMAAVAAVRPGVAGGQAGAQHGHRHGENGNKKHKGSSHRNRPLIGPSQETNHAAARFRGWDPIELILFRHVRGRRACRTSCPPIRQPATVNPNGFFSRQSFLLGFSSASFRLSALGFSRAADA